MKAQRLSTSQCLHRRWVSGGTILLLLFLMLVILPMTSLAENPQQVYLPLVHTQANHQAVPFGVEIIPGGMPRVSQQAGELGVGWVRLNGISWQAVQPDQDTNPEEWNWEALESFDHDLQAALALNLTPIVVVDDTPVWARIHEQYPCSAIRTDRFDDYARFLKAIVARYSKPPYNVRYWELGNEVDVPWQLTSDHTAQYFGCWGDIEDPYYGGEHYGRMLNAVVPHIKEVDSSAQILAGGLMLDTPQSDADSRQGHPERFFEGVLRVGAAANFDIVSFHSYPTYAAERGGRLFDSDRLNPKWKHMGGMTIGKARFLRETMQRYDVDKPLFLDEVSLLLPEGVNTVTDDYVQAQADMIVRLLARGMFADIQVICWYTLNGPGWRNAALLDRNQLPRPAYLVYQDFLAHTQPSRDTLQVSNEYTGEIEAYRFIKYNHDVDVVWASKPTTTEVEKALFTVAYTRFGARIHPIEQTATTLVYPVDISPIYIHHYYSFSTMTAVSEELAR